MSAVTDPQVLLIGDHEAGRFLTPQLAVDALEAMYRELGTGTGVDRARSRTSLAVPGAKGRLRYTVNSMEGGGQHAGYYALRINSVMWDWVDSESGPRRKILPGDVGADSKFDGMICLFDTATSLLVAFIPNFSVSRRRVAGSSAVAAKFLARPESSTLGIIGSGSHAVSHALTFAQHFPLEVIKVWGPTPDHVREFAARVSNRTGIRVDVVAGPDEAVDADLVVTATNSMTPVLKSSWLRLGTHLTSVNPPEMPLDLEDVVDRVILKSRESVQYFQSDDVGEEPNSQPRSDRVDDRTELSEVVAGKVAGRDEADQITFFANNTGLGSEFAAIGAVVYREAIEAGAGHRVPLELFSAPKQNDLFGRAWQQR